MNTEAYEAIIGLEVHTHLLTESKLFCGCSTRFGAGPNDNVCPICMGMPGVLPVLNRHVVELAIRTGLATHCAIAPYSIFDRKSYFYPDLPKGYQISQYETPICKGGYIDLPADGDGQPRRVRLTRIHIEEDAGKNIHAAGASLIDFNRSGVPLIEIVSEPDLRSSADAGAYLRQLREILQDIGASDGRMEEGSFRCDCNVSVRKKGATEFGTRTEIKNLNSFRFVENAIDHEVERQVEILEAGNRVPQETLLWDSVHNETRPMRSKEFANDYRYFPEPDLPPLIVEDKMVEQIRSSMPKLRADWRGNYLKEDGLTEYEAEVITSTPAVADYYNKERTNVKNRRIFANVIINDVLRIANSSSKPFAESVPPSSEVAIVSGMVADQKISNNAVRTILLDMVETYMAAEQVLTKLGLAQVSDESAIAAACDKIIAAEPAKLAEYRAGRDKLFGFFVGQVMKAMGGKANPKVINDVLKQKLTG